MLKLLAKVAEKYAKSTNTACGLFGWFHQPKMPISLIKRDEDREENASLSYILSISNCCLNNLSVFVVYKFKLLFLFNICLTSHKPKPVFLGLVE